MAEITENLLSELLATVIFQGHLNKPQQRTKLDFTNFNRRLVQIICIPNDGFTKLFYLAKRKSSEYFGALEKDKLVLGLAYWKDTEIIPCRVICLDGCHVYETIDEVGTPVENCFTLVTKKRKFFFQASSEREKKAWIDILGDVLEANALKVGNNHHYEFVKTKLSDNESEKNLESKGEDNSENMYATVKFPQENNCSFWSSKKRGDRDSGISSRSASNNSDQQPPNYGNKGWSEPYDQVSQHGTASKPQEGPSYPELEPNEPRYETAKNIRDRRESCIGSDKVKVDSTVNLQFTTTDPVYEIPGDEVELTQKISYLGNNTTPVQEEGCLLSKTSVDGSLSMLYESKVDEDQDVFEDNSFDGKSGQNRDLLNRTASAPVSQGPTPKPRPRATRYTDSEIELSKKRRDNISTLCYGGLEVKFNVEHCNANFCGKKMVFYKNDLAYEHVDETLVFEYLEIKFKAKSGFKIRSSHGEVDISNDKTGYSVKVERKLLPTFV